MTLLEGTIVFILLLLAMPGLCKRLGRPGLVFPSYILAGAVAGLVMSDPVIETWRQIGQLGFILLLFSVGLEIELPEKRESLVALRRALLWMLPQAGLITGVLVLLGTEPLFASVAGVALSSTSVGMAYVLWSHHVFSSKENGRAFLEWMVAIEVLAILYLAVIGPVLSGSLWWVALLRLCGLLLAAGIAALVALRYVPRFADMIKKGLRIEVPLLVLLLFSICALGDRLGLSAPKMAFVLGLFISRSTDEEVALSHKLEPLRDRMFVPVFFFGLGTLLRWETVSTWGFGIALLAGIGLFLLRRLLFGFGFSRCFSVERGAHSMASPVLTLVAVSVEVLVHAGASASLVSWTLAAGLSLTLCAAFRPLGGDLHVLDYEPKMVSPEFKEALHHQKHS